MVSTAFKEPVYSCPRKPKHAQTLVCRPGSRWERGGRGPGDRKWPEDSPAGASRADSAALPGDAAGRGPALARKRRAPRAGTQAGWDARRAPRGRGTAGLGSPMKRQKRSRQMSSARLLPPLLGLLLRAGLPPFLLSGTIALSYL